MSRSSYRITAALPEALLIHVSSLSYGSQLWSRGARSVRKQHICALCGNAITAGDLAYHPLTNAVNRGARICVPCVEAAITRQERPMLTSDTPIEVRVEDPPQRFTVWSVSSHEGMVLCQDPDGRLWDVREGALARDDTGLFVAVRSLSPEPPKTDAARQQPRKEPS